MSDASVPAGPQPWRTALTALIFVGLFATVVARLHHLQVELGPNLASRGDKQRVRKWAIPAARGNIYDGAGVPLAVSDGKWAVYADPGYMDDRLRATVELSRLLGIPREELRKHFEARGNGRRLAKGLDDAVAGQIKALKLAGIAVRREFLRVYPEGALAPHVLGFVLDDNTGGAGLEQEFERTLAGVPGLETLAVDALGAPIVLDGETRAARPGANIQLTIDVEIQRELETALLAAVERHKPKNAAAVVIRPGTGDILALASWPTYDGRDRSKLDPASMRNNVLTFVYEPGSTMKPLVAGAAVHEGLTTWQEPIFCENGRWTHRVGKSARTITDHSVKHGGHQNLTVTQGIALSDNILMAKLGLRLGPERLNWWITQLGFGQRTGITLPGEDVGIVLAKSKWNILGSCLSVPMGHEIAVTPLQMAMAHAAIANGGVRMPPRLVRRVWQVDPASGEERELTAPALGQPRRMFSVEDAARVQEAMTSVMTKGTGENAALDGYTSAGKTGTTEKLVNGRYSKSNHIGSFVCWAPASAERRPELLALVVIDDPTQNGHYGSETAAPVVQKVLQFSLEHLRVTPDRERDPKADAVSAKLGHARGRR
ncbi:MAG: penicillin-binding protein 2 [Planctomycetes bacterium]|nr:penicillin-binding protein 2 [Planctomycetota bacterium]